MVHHCMNHHKFVTHSLPSNMAASAVTVMLTGWGHKEGSVLRSWKRRFFIARTASPTEIKSSPVPCTHLLLYYKTKELASLGWVHACRLRQELPHASATNSPRHGLFVGVWHSAGVAVCSTHSDPRCFCSQGCQASNGCQRPQSADLPNEQQMNSPLMRTLQLHASAVYQSRDCRTYSLLPCCKWRISPYG